MHNFFKWYVLHFLLFPLSHITIWEILKNATFGRFVLKNITLKEDLRSCYFLVMNLTEFFFLYTNNEGKRNEGGQYNNLIMKKVI